MLSGAQGSMESSRVEANMMLSVFIFSDSIEMLHSWAQNLPLCVNYLCGCVLVVCD